jgi:hypothetical protein
LSILEAFSDVINGLILGDRILSNTSFNGIEFSDFRFVGQTIFKLSKGRKKASTIGLQFTLLTAKAKLNGEPVALKTEKDVIKGCLQLTSQTF